MKKLLLICAALMLAGCVAYPVYDDGYYYPYPYGYYGYGYYGFVEPDVHIFVSGGYAGHGFRGFHGSHGFYGSGHGRGGRR